LVAELPRIRKADQTPVTLQFGASLFVAIAFPLALASPSTAFYDKRTVSIGNLSAILTARAATSRTFDGLRPIAASVIMLSRVQRVGKARLRGGVQWVGKQ
jgi:hypothetical protein